MDETVKHSHPHPTAAGDCIPSNSEGIPFSFGQQLDALLRQKYFRNKKLADRAGISPNLIAHYRRGKASCSPERAYQLAQILGCTETQRIALTRAAALTTQNPIGECIQAMLIERSISRSSIQSVAPSATANQLNITTVDGAVVTLTISIDNK